MMNHPTMSYGEESAWEQQHRNVFKNGESRAPLLSVSIPSSPQGLSQL